MYGGTSSGQIEVTIEGLLVALAAIAKLDALGFSRLTVHKDTNFARDSITIVFLFKCSNSDYHVLTQFDIDNGGVLLLNEFPLEEAAAKLAILKDR